MMPTGFHIQSNDVSQEAPWKKFAFERVQAFYSRPFPLVQEIRAVDGHVCLLDYLATSLNFQQPFPLVVVPYGTSHGSESNCALPSRSYSSVVS